MATLTCDPLTEIARRVEERHGVDFRCYKPRVLNRRLQSRVRALGLPDLEAYLRHLDTDPQEVERLFQALAINFSFFYRDRELFRLLGKRVLPDLVKRFPDGPLRVWSAGCAAGEELYSLAILAHETLPPAECQRLELLGTDIDEHSLEEGRSGRYPRSRVAFLDNPLIGKYFHSVAAGGELQIIEALRMQAEFRRADLMGPAPYRKCSLVCCRNVMIYLQPKHQETILLRLAEALRPGGVLVLGRVERLHRRFRDWFETVDTAERVYRRLSTGSKY
ncbi:MAG: protein-glutamate O-methyltransferase CheR [Acidobacteriota bacterium]